MKRRKFLAVASAAAFAPRAAAAQPAQKVYRVAILAVVDSPSDLETRNPLYMSLFHELRRLGYVEGRNLVVERRSAEGDTSRFPAIAREIAALKPHVIVSTNALGIAALKAATTTIPIVVFAGDPVGSGLAASLVRPGGNITGFTFDAGPEVTGKRIELLKQTIPSISRIAYLAPSRRGMHEEHFGMVFQAAAERAGLTPIDAPLDNPADEAAYRRAFAAMVRDRVDAVYAMGAAENYINRRLIAELAAAARLPSVHSYRESVEAGGLMAYAADLAEIFRLRIPGYVDRILKGADPAELPFQQPTKFELVINMKTAKVLGVAIPPSLLGIADEIIE